MHEFEVENMINEIIGTKANKIPEYLFALREDLENEPHFLPTKAEPNATGYDVKAAQLDRKPIIVRPGKYVTIPLGFRGMPPDGWWYQLNPRSSFFAKKHMHCLIGIIDQDFSLELLLAAQYLPDISSMGNDLVINFGDPIGQIIPVKRQKMDIKEVTNKQFNKLVKDRNSERTGGFGSTDVPKKEK